MDVHIAFRMGAAQLARDNRKYGTLHKEHGIDQHEWSILTQDEYWSPDQARQMRTVLASAVEVSMTIAGIPAIPLPGQYVAAFIAEVVSPCNRFVACTKAPDTFDAMDASGLMTTSEVTTMTTQQLMALVLAYSGGFQGEPSAHRLPKKVNQQMEMENVK